MAANQQHAYVTLLMTDNYLPGAMVLAHSLRDNGTTKQLVALVTLDTIAATTVEELRTVYDHVIPIERVTNASPANLYLMNRGDLASTFSKIELWKLTQFTRVVYLDADVVALRAPDELFDLASRFAAAPDVGWPDIFNSGVMALTPNLQDYYALQALARAGVSFDGADQGLLNMHFPRNTWERLSFTYNCTPSGNYQYAPAYKHFGSQISIVHFIGKEKPWQAGRQAKGFGGVYQELTARWWAVYDRYYRGSQNAAISGQAPAHGRSVQQFVTGEATPNDYGFSSAPVSSSVPPQSDTRPQQEIYQPQPQRQIPITVIHPPAEEHRVEERRFSAPHAEWDPARAPPPAQSRPEAANFPSQVYAMSDDTKLFQAPQSYPEPPKDMWYEVPKERPHVAERPRPIFPWETNQTPATRVFPDESPPPPIPNPDHKPAPLPSLDTSGREESVSQPANAYEDELAVFSPPPVAVQPQSFADYTRTNAWDDDPHITRYMEQLKDSQMRRKARHSPAPSLSSITGEKKSERRGSLLLTDFPTQVERPSLPVTPAARPRSFWGTDESTTTADLPPAEGVPSQAEWDPSESLARLRRTSETFLEKGPATAKSLPSREQITSGAPTTIPEDNEDTTTAPVKGQPTFAAVNFGSDGQSEDGPTAPATELEETLSPIALAKA